jgi:hypothetical protein
MEGVAVGTPRKVTRSGAKFTLRVGIGTWPSGLYFARLSAARGNLGFAPFVVRPKPYGAARVAVVLPTNTWQAYNFRDVDGDGTGDTWYADPRIPSVDLSRPYLSRGVPPRYRGFLRWLASTSRAADVLSDDDLERFRGGRQLARLYTLIVFAGHEEYVTEHVYDMIERYRDLGGNLAFLSSNNFFYRVVRRGSRIHRTGRWIDLGRVDAKLIGVHYIGWNEGRYRNRPYVVTGAARAPWFFRGTALRNGASFGFSYGVEIDARSAASPRGTIVLATIPHIFGRGRTATMTYYETGRGAKVFAAGAMNFDAPQSPVTAKLLGNLWEHLSRP